MKTAIIIITLFSLSILAMGAIAYSGYVISWFTIDGGGGESAGGMYTLSGTLGQTEAGPTMGGGDYTLSGGFWGGAATTVSYIYLPLIQR